MNQEWECEINTGIQDYYQISLFPTDRNRWSKLNEDSSTYGYTLKISFETEGEEYSFLHGSDGVISGDPLINNLPYFSVYCPLLTRKTVSFSVLFALNFYNADEVAWSTFSFRANAQTDPLITENRFYLLQFDDIPVETSINTNDFPFPELQKEFKLPTGFKPACGVGAFSFDAIEKKILLNTIFGNAFNIPVEGLTDFHHPREISGNENIVLVLSANRHSLMAWNRDENRLIGIKTFPQACSLMVLCADQDRVFIGTEDMNLIQWHLTDAARNYNWSIREFSAGHYSLAFAGHETYLTCTANDVAFTMRLNEDHSLTEILNVNIESRNPDSLIYDPNSNALFWSDILRLYPAIENSSIIRKAGSSGMEDIVRIPDSINRLSLIKPNILVAHGSECSWFVDLSQKKIKAQIPDAVSVSEIDIKGHDVYRWHSYQDKVFCDIYSVIF